jgi:hypothetical protein
MMMVDGVLYLRMVNAMNLLRDPYDDLPERGGELIKSK